MSQPHWAITWTIAATAATTLLVAAIIFFLVRKFCVGRRDKPRNEVNTGFGGRNVKGVIVDEDGMEVFYLKKVQGGQHRSTNFPKVVLNPSFEEDEEEEKRMNVKEETCKPHDDDHHHQVQFLPLNSSEFIAKHVVQNPKPLTPCPSMLLTKPTPLVLPPPPPPPPPPIPAKRKPLLPPLPKPPTFEEETCKPHEDDHHHQVQFLPLDSSEFIAKHVVQNPKPLTPSPSMLLTKPTPLVLPPPPPPPPPPPILAKRKLLLPPLPKPPTSGRANYNKNRVEISGGENSKTIGFCQMKLKPLHWDKVTADVDHSMVWNEINDGSFRVDDELMETLFGYKTTNHESLEKNNNMLSANSSKLNSVPPTQIFILDPRKSQNTAIVLRSLAISRKEIVDALIDGGHHEVGVETLEKLTKISPTEQEETMILNFNGDPNKLGDAESFLYHILKCVPSAFTRFNAMLFRANYEPEILHLKESLQTLELGCKELRAGGTLFLKLLEAVLKAGNRMNAGTTRGNALGFNLCTLRKLSDIKSTDGKTTLLHFVVEQVARSEGRRGRCGIEEKDILSTSEERDKEYLILGLQVLQGLSTELSNAKKAASIEYQTFVDTCCIMIGRLVEIEKLVSQCGNSSSGGFVRDMRVFLKECEEEIKVVREEQTRVMEVVKRTKEYYRAGGNSNIKGEDPLKIFFIVKDFIDMVDQVCVEITSKSMQKKSVVQLATSSSSSININVGSSPPLSTQKMLQNLNSHFIANMVTISSSESETSDFSSCL